MDIIFETLKSENYLISNKLLIRSIGLHETILFSELVSKRQYYESIGQLQEDGSFYATIDDIEFNTGLKEKAQVSAINNLKKLGLIDVAVKGVPPRRYFKITATKELIERLMDNGRKATPQKKQGGDTNNNIILHSSNTCKSSISPKEEINFSQERNQFLQKEKLISPKEEQIRSDILNNNNINNKNNKTNINKRENSKHTNNNLLRNNNKVSDSVCKNLPEEKISKIKSFLKQYKLQNLEKFILAYTKTIEKLENILILLESRYFANTVINKPAFLKSAIRYNYNFSYLKDEQKAKDNNTAIYQKSAQKTVNFLTRDPSEYDGLEEIFKNAVRKNNMNETNYGTDSEYFSKVKEECKTQETIKAEASRDSNTSIDNNIDELIEQLDIEFELDFKNRHGYNPVFQTVSTLAI